MDAPTTLALMAAIVRRVFCPPRQIVFGLQCRKQHGRCGRLVCFGL
jgi:hypothetical protein